VDKSSGSPYVLHTDAQGSVRVITDSAANVVETYYNDEYGNPLITLSASAPNNVASQPLQYTAEPRDVETGFIYLRARMYDPSLGRFLQRDSYAGTGSRPLSLNRYVYTENSPLSRSDPGGAYDTGPNGPSGPPTEGMPNLWTGIVTDVAPWDIVVNGGVSNTMTSPQTGAAINVATIKIYDAHGDIFDGVANGGSIYWGAVAAGGAGANAYWRGGDLPTGNATTFGLALTVAGIAATDSGLAFRGGNLNSDGSLATREADRAFLSAGIDIGPYGIRSDATGQTIGDSRPMPGNLHFAVSPGLLTG
jgi:RHS repeat-associated protein